MGLLSFIGGILPGFSNRSENRSAIIEEYHRLRDVRVSLNVELGNRMSRDVIEEGAKRLGMFRRGMVVFKCDEETSVLMDYCIYDVLRNGRNAVEQYLDDSPPPACSDEMRVLAAMRQSSYGLIVVLDVESNAACRVRNMFTNKEHLLVDVAMSRTASSASVMLARLIDFGEYVVTSGAAIPLGVLSFSELHRWQSSIDRGMPDGNLDPAQLIQAAIRSGAMSRIRYLRPGDELDDKRRDVLDEELDDELDDASHDDSYGDPREPFDVVPYEGPYDASKAPRRSTMKIVSPSPEVSAKRKRELAMQRSAKSAPSKRCHCGSGKMYKNCCMNA